MKVAICYDRINKFGGAERVLLALHEIWPAADVFTLTYSPEKTAWTKGWRVKSSFLQKIPLLGEKHELFPPLAGIAWKQFDFTGYDLIISITSAEAKGLRIPEGATHICYCLTPIRYYWSGYFHYLAHTGFQRFEKIIRFFFLFFAHFLRVSDFFDAQRPTYLIGISDEVCSRIRKYYRRECTKIYPPVDLPENIPAKGREREYFLVVSRLVPYKHVDIVVKAFSQSGLPLKVVGTGSEMERLKKMAGSSVQFEGFIDDKQLANYYQHAIALIFPTDEDFGIVPVEAQSYGVPVVALRSGGVLETIVEGETGVFFDEQSADSLNKALFSRGESIEQVKAYFSSFREEACFEQARKFRKERFQKEFKEFVAEKIA